MGPDHYGEPGVAYAHRQFCAGTAAPYPLMLPGISRMVASVLIPILSVFWRTLGAVKFRVFFV
jgi:hypothetical protein